MTQNCNKKIDIKSMTYEELLISITALGEKKFRASQIFTWLHKERVLTFDDMTNVSAVLRKKLEDSYYISVIKAEKVLHSKIDSTTKFLFKLEDEQYIESVFMQYAHGNTLCISSQVGCAMGCKFCASTIGGKIRNLTSSEMLAQIEMAEKITTKKVNNVVMMGIGEPLDNYKNLITFLALINHPDGMGIGHRHLCVSTCGIVPKIFELAEKKLQLTLSVSLHASQDSIRDKIMPINKKYNLESLIDSCEYYFAKTSRRISFEYALIYGVNDNEDEARNLARLLKGMSCHVNLIPINNVTESGFIPPKRINTEMFKDTLEELGITTTIRRTLGSDINAACGQLRRENS